MIFVDSSVWIDYFNGVRTLQTERLHAALPREEVASGDLVVAEVLQGYSVEREFKKARATFDTLEIIRVVTYASAIESAQNYRRLRASGITIRKTIDTLIATRCMIDDMALLYVDRDFDPFVEHLGLRSAMA